MIEICSYLDSLLIRWNFSCFHHLTITKKGLYVITIYTNNIKNLTRHLHARYGWSVIAWSTNNWGRIFANKYRVLWHARIRCVVVLGCSVGWFSWPSSSSTRICLTKQSTICLHAVTRDFGGSVLIFVTSSLSSLGLNICVGNSKRKIYYIFYT